MKKSVALIFAGLMMMSMVACSPSGNNNSNTSSNVQSNVSSSENIANSADTPLELLNTVWKSYSDDEKFPVAGGDFSEENNSMDGPGKYALDDADAIESSFGLPAGSVSKIEDAASLMHMMNANTFTCSALRVKDGEDAKAVATEIKDTLKNRQWVCGMPDKLVIFINGNDVVTAFGENEIMATFTEKMKTAFPSAELSADETITVE